MHQHDAACTHGPGEAGVPVGLAHEAASAGHAQAAGPVTYAPPQPPDSRLYRLMMTLWTRPPWLAPLAILAWFAAAFAYVLANNPTDNVRDPLGPCAFKAMTGWDCPGCGGTRMVWYLLHADLPEAFRHHMIALVAVPVLVYLFVWWATKRIFAFSLPSLRIPGKVWGGYLVVWLVFSVLRNLPWEPFSYFYVT